MICRVKLRRLPVSSLFEPPALESLTAGLLMPGDCFHVCHVARVEHG